MFYRLHACYHGQGVGISSVEHWDDLKVKLSRTVGTDEQTTNFVMQDCLLITRILDLNFLYIFILHRHGGSFELCFICIFVWVLRQFCLF